MSFKLIFPILFLICSNLCVSQNYHDSLTFEYLDSIWTTPAPKNVPMISLDSNKLDTYKISFPSNKNGLRMKFGYVRDDKQIYCFEIISSNLELFLKNTETFQYPGNGTDSVFF